LVSKNSAWKLESGINMYLSNWTACFVYNTIDSKYSYKQIYRYKQLNCLSTTDRDSKYS
jgi:hypothetical protein